MEMLERGRTMKTREMRNKLSVSASSEIVKVKQHIRMRILNEWPTVEGVTYCRWSNLVSVA
jgi:hypothetical protein